MTTKRYCFKCGKQLVSAMSGKESFTVNCPPSNALAFISSGNYGSTIFDPFMDSSDYLEIMICDDCVNSSLACVKKVIKIETKVKMVDFRKDE
jgi:hypothetical protein